MASHNHFLISERGQRKETMTEGHSERTDKSQKDTREGEPMEQEEGMLVSQ